MLKNICDKNDKMYKLSFYRHMLHYCSVLMKYCYMKVKIKKQSFANLFLFYNYANRTVMSIK